MKLNIICSSQQEGSEPWLLDKQVLNKKAYQTQLECFSIQACVKADETNVYIEDSTRAVLRGKGTVFVNK